MTKKFVSIKILEDILRKICSNKELQPYEDLGNGLYKLPGGVITGKKGLDLYLKTLHDEVDHC
jgi:hypothetical protein